MRIRLIGEAMDWLLGGATISHSKVSLEVGWELTREWAEEAESLFLRRHELPLNDRMRFHSYTYCQPSSLR